MTDEVDLAGPKTDRWGPDAVVRTRESVDETRFDFRLSGGLMSANRSRTELIDSLLARMTDSSAVRYIPNIDKNLDYLFTYLQLDLINSVAERLSRRGSEMLRVTGDEAASGRE